MQFPTDSLTRFPLLQPSNYLNSKHLITSDKPWMTTKVPKLIEIEDAMEGIEQTNNDTNEVHIASQSVKTEDSKQRNSDDFEAQLALAWEQFSISGNSQTSSGK